MIRTSYLKFMYHKTLENIQTENISSQEESVARFFIKKLPESWRDYKQQLKHKHRQLSLAYFIIQIIIEDTDVRELKNTKEIASKSNLAQGKNLRTKPYSQQIAKWLINSHMEIEFFIRHFQNFNLVSVDYLAKNLIANPLHSPSKPYKESFTTIFFFLVILVCHCTLSPLLPFVFVV